MKLISNVSVAISLPKGIVEVSVPCPKCGVDSEDFEAKGKLPLPREEEIQKREIGIVCPICFPNRGVKVATYWERGELVVDVEEFEVS